MVIKKVGVVGAGMMGAEIALCFAQAGYNTVMSDVSKEQADKGKANLDTLLEKRIQKGKLTMEQKTGSLANITTTGNLADMADCDLIIEAVVEILKVKHNIYKQLDTLCKPETIIASNTSSISITKLGSVMSERRAMRFIGTHFNSPASVMKLVEVIPALLTDGAVTERVRDLLSMIGKEPVTVKDVVGFALNRMFHVFYLEACRLIEDGVCSVEDVDKICLYGLGHPMGIFRLLDLTGHDLNSSVDKILFDAYGDRFRQSAYMQRLVDSGRLGKKVGQGFYSYEK